MRTFRVTFHAIIVLLAVKEGSTFLSKCVMRPDNAVRAAVGPTYYIASDSKTGNLNFRAMEETTRNLLNGTSVGEWNETCFEDVADIMQAWSNWQSRRSAIMVERLLRRVVEEQMAGNPYGDNVDMTAMYNSLIMGWANSGEPGGPERAEEILDYMQQIYEAGDSDDPLFCGPEISAFNAVILAFARSGRWDAPQQAIRVLTKLYDWNRSGRTDVAPTKETYAAVLRAFARKGTPDAPELVKRLLEHMESLALNYPSVKPDYNCHNTYLDALLNSMNKGYLTGFDAAKLANKYLNRMLSSTDEIVQPDSWSFIMVMNAWSRSGSYEMVDRAEKLIQQLEDYHVECGYSEKTEPNSNAYNVLIACYGRSQLADKAERAKRVMEKMKKLAESGVCPKARPDTITYNSVMNAYAKSRSKDAPYEVETLLHEMQQIYESGDRSVKPNSRSFNTCLDAWAKSGIPGSADRIMDWIEKMKENVKLGLSTISPNKWTYNAYLQALSKTGGPEMGREAERVLEEMKELSKGGDPDLKPDVLTMTNVIHCIALSGQDDALERAMSILNHMEDLHAKGIGDVRPNLFTYNCVINAAAKSKKPGKAQIALRMLRRMESVALRPQTVSYNNVLNACAFSNHRDDDPQKILDVALGVLNEAQKGPGANWITYQTVLRVLCSFCNDEKKRWELARKILDDCKRDQQLTRSVMQQVRFAVTPGQYALIESEVLDPNTDKLCREYTSNARKLKMSPPSRD